MERIILFGIMLLFAVSVSGQIQGDVVDSTDKGVPNAIIIATTLVKNIADTIKTDKRGFYSFNGLKPGKYKIEVKADGFQPAVIENVVVKEEHTGKLIGGDLYSGQRLDITMYPLNGIK
jgi:hypothetical protein